MEHILGTYSNENILIIGDSTLTSVSNSELIKNTLYNDSIQEVKILHQRRVYCQAFYNQFFKS